MVTTYKGNGKGKGHRKDQFTLTDDQIDKVVELYTKQTYTVVELGELFYVSRWTISRALERRNVERRFPGVLGSNDVPTRRIINQREKEGMSFREIGRRNAMSHSAVRDRYFNYRKKYPAKQKD